MKIKPKIFLLDVDGVMTNGQFLYSSKGKSFKIFGLCEILIEDVREIELEAVIEIRKKVVSKVRNRTYSNYLLAEME